MSAWKARAELFGSWKVARMVLVDPDGVIRASFSGLAKDPEQRELARRIAAFLNLLEEEHE